MCQDSKVLKISVLQVWGWGHKALAVGSQQLRGMKKVDDHWAKTPPGKGESI